MAIMHKKGELSMKKYPDGSEELSSSVYQGLLLPPEWLKEYKEIDPEFPARIIKCAEEESSHRHWFERKYIKDRFIMNLSSYISSILVTGGILLVACLFMINGFALEGMWIALSTAGVVGIFIIRKYMAENSGNNQPPN